MQQPTDQANILYIYDLPKKQFTSVKLAEIIKSVTGYDMAQHHMPQVSRDSNKPFYSARIKIDNSDKFREVANKLRHFDFMGHPVRALPYQSDLLGTNVTRLAEQNLFVRRIPKALKSGQLEEIFSAHGEIISCKISLNEDYTSRGYGFVCFKEPTGSQKALEATSTCAEMMGVKFAPRSKTDMRKVFNNIFVKNMPDRWSEADLVSHFEVFGNITSVFVNRTETGAFAFICFGNPNNLADREYGPSCAQKAVEAMNDKLVDGKALYVRPALKKSERQRQLAHETFKFHNSRKRCNLFVKNFPYDITEEEIRSYFSSHGEIESLKVFQDAGKTSHAFVCYRQPEVAQMVKNTSHEIRGRILFINHYEIKQQRELINETNRDKLDWQRYQSEHSLSEASGTHMEIQNYDQLSNLLRLLIHSFQKQQSTPEQAGNNKGPRPPMRPPHPDQPMKKQPQPPRPMSQQPQPKPQMPQINVASSHDPVAQEFYAKTIPVYYAVSEVNPNYKPTVGGAIFEFVSRRIGSQLAPKITGMLIDLPIQQIQGFMRDYDQFVKMVAQAHSLLASKSKDEPQA